jgi:hypothetical protein
MKLLAAILLLTATLLAQTPTPHSATEDPSAKKARAMVQQMIQALGGQAYLTYQDKHEVGRSYSFYKGESAGVGIQFWRYWRWPDKERVELTKQRDWIIIHNGDQGVEITFRGSAAEEPLPLADFIRRRDHSMETVLRRWLSEPGIAYFYDGAAIANQKPVERVTIMNSRNDSVTFSLDSNSHLPIQKSFTWRDKDRERNEDGEIFDNYRPVQGIMTPFSITRTRNGETTNQRFINTVVYNQGLADAMFTPPPITPKPARK